MGFVTDALLPLLPVTSVTLLYTPLGIARRQLPTADGTGEIDREELAPLLRSLGISLSRESLADALFYLDPDAAGSIGREELAGWVAQVIREFVAYHIVSYLK